MTFLVWTVVATANETQKMTATECEQEEGERDRPTTPDHEEEDERGLRNGS